jgi:hypothetical protein
MGAKRCFSLEQGRFGRHQNLQGLIENWSLKIGRWPLNSASPAAQFPFLSFQWPSRWRFQSASPTLFDPRLEHLAAESRLQAPGNPFREACNLSKNFGQIGSNIEGDENFHFGCIHLY